MTTNDHSGVANLDGSSPRRTAFVTGSTGFLGLNLIAQLVTDGWQVTALHRPQSNLTYLRRFPVQLVQGCIEDAGSLAAVVPENVDAVFHAAADVSFWSGHKERQTRTNVDGTRNMVAVALQKGVRKFIHTSTTAVYGFPAGPFDETAPHLGRHSGFNYLATKAEAEEEVRNGIAQGLDAVILNPANIVGPYDLHNWSRLILLAAQGKLPRVPPGSGCFCHAVDVARAHLTAVDRGRRGENYILGGVDASYVEVVRLIGEVLNRRVNARPIPPRLLRGVGRLLGWASWVTRREPFVTPESAAYLCADIVCRSDKAIRELGYQVRPLRSLLEDCCRWLTAEGLLPASTGTGGTVSPAGPAPGMLSDVSSRPQEQSP
jgi:nucleoside-diphosphate-sugar epimerase